MRYDCADRGVTGVTVQNEQIILGGKGKYWLGKQFCFEVDERIGALFRPNPFGLAVSKCLKDGGVALYETSVVASKAQKTYQFLRICGSRPLSGSHVTPSWLMMCPRKGIDLLTVSIPSWPYVDD